MKTLKMDPFTLGAIAELVVKNWHLLQVEAFHRVPHAIMKERIRLDLLARAAVQS